MVSPPPPGPVYQHNDTPCAGPPRGRFPRYFLLLIGCIAILGIGIGVVCGWALRGMTTQNAIAPTATAPASTAAAAGGTTTAQAKQQACDGYSALGAQWSSGAKEWHNVVVQAGPGWSWADPAIKAETDKFFPAQSEIAVKLRALVGPQTPPAVASAINDYAAALLSFAAIQNSNTTGVVIDSKLDTINNAADIVVRQCGI